MRKIKILLLLTGLNASFLWAMGTRSSGLGQSFGLSQGAVRFYYQVTQFQTPDGIRAEISYSLPYDQVQFVSQGTQFRAAYSFSVIVTDAKGGQVAGDSWERSLTVGKYQELQKGNYLACDTFSLKVIPGRYKFLIICTDNNSERRGESEMNVEIRDLSGGLLELSGLRFQKMQNEKLVPWPKRQYGDGHGDIMFYYQIYSSQPESILAGYSLSRIGSTDAAWSLNETLGQSGNPGITKSVRSDSLLTGSYILKLEVRQAGRSVVSSESLYVRNSKFITDRDYREQVDQLEYVSKGREFDSLRKASPALRETLLLRFWQLRDPDTTTMVNEFRDGYYDRINYANEQFGSIFKPGWKSDRGMVYILFGPADEIERHPFDIEYPAYEIWYYYSDGRRYVFMDRKGIGEYELIYPKREKIR
ncbi:GWxTD domain-containing protein [candidate division TA06 bacterium]|nr:GWxTD domain-containing protein [candidate division TA06 bacterium]